MKNLLYPIILICFICCISCEKEDLGQNEIDKIDKIEFYYKRNTLVINDSMSIVTKLSFDFSGNISTISCSETQDNFSSFYTLLNTTNLSGFTEFLSSSIPFDQDFIYIFRNNVLSERYLIDTALINQKEQLFYDKLKEEYDSFDYCQ